MASAVQISLVALVVLFAVFHIGTGLNCIHCTTKEECAKNTSKPCTGDNTYCLKIENGKGDNIKEKKCGTVAECEDFKNCYSCNNEDNCNSSSNMVPSFLLMGILGTIVAKRYM